ncbi:DUF5694 domain-containing protein [Erythrobacter sp.]|uniref:DUF5694 domain-containing protein n=1 Tax=Erythrobacter sp. TaxID=1042 RepID=UPI001B0B1254|nr:DUF5694 domain-containing protein [Erythrobacter sp.]MBO6525886.1 hypothetical protein [Erythrobacter sp.]MBO6529439.1 hypothetical protein [Erythrobacter sp.]
MPFRAFLAACLTVFSAPAWAEEQPAEPAPVEVMVLGMYHFANPGLDVVNIDVDDVLAPRRQGEIGVLVDTLAEWRPTRIVVENQAEAPALEMADFDRTEELLKTTRNESVQVGYRLARQLGHEAVYGYDEQPGEGEPDYFPMGKVQAFAAENGGEELLANLFAEVQAMAAEEQARLPDQTIAESLLTHNDPARVEAMHDRLYYSLLKIGDGDAQPGAELNAYWYMRNAKMFAKIDMIAEPGDRVLVLAGSGHATWLRHFVRHMPGYELVEALPYVERAAGL